MHILNIFDITTIFSIVQFALEHFNLGIILKVNLEDHILIDCQ